MILSTRRSTNALWLILALAASWLIILAGWAVVNAVALSVIGRAQ